MKETLKISLVAYLLIAVVVFGHAAVRQDRLEKEYVATCKAEGRKTCVYWGSGVELFQALLWPLYVSYMAWER